MNRFLALLIVSVAFVQCGNENIDLPIVNETEYIETTSSSYEEFSNSLNLSAANLFVELCQSDKSDANQVISPLSIQTATALLLNGAHENTAKELKQFLNLENETIGGINTHFSNLSKKTQESNTISSYLNINNAAVWDNSKMTMNSSFLNRLENSFSADHIDDNFTVNEVNTWAVNATDGLIKEVIKEIQDEEVLFLLNALLFRGDWLNGFIPDITQTVSTQLPNGDITEYDMMLSDSDHYQFEDEEIQAVNMKFADEAYEMIVIQPKNEELLDFINIKGGKGLADLLLTLSDEVFLKSRLVLRFPKLEVKYKENISETLIALGIVDAFSNSSARLDSLGMSGGNLFVSRILHDTYFKLDEKGVEGAAVTTVGVAANSVPPSFTFDKPFILCLRTSADKIPVFMGKIGDPGIE